ncbi:MAG: hypothetical protein F7C38_07860 [Desulfurococcales archaeon]|nr:hypothetical protein [Desulfurococcales archaeon]
MARIKIKLMATLAERVGKRVVEIEASNWREALKRLRETYKELADAITPEGDPMPSYMLFVDGVDYRLYSNKDTPREIVILPTIHGGSDQVDIELVEWSNIDEGVDIVASRIRDSHFTPDVVVGVLRGGVVPARLIADKLGVEDMTVMEVKLYKAPGIRGEKPYLRQPPTLSLTDRRVLIVDDISDSGLTLQLAVEAVNLYLPREVRTATVYIKPWTEFMPDYYAFTTRSWIVFPWERGEFSREPA